MISVIIPAYNEEKHIGDCLKALRRSEYDGDFEVIVADNNSTDGTRKIAEKLADKVIGVKPRGIAHARNGAIRASRGDIIASTDADCIVGRQWLAEIEKAFEDPRVVGVTGPVLAQGGGLKHRLMYRLIWTGLAKTLLAIRMPAFSGNNCAYRRELLFRAGLFNTKVRPGEDIELSQRMRRMGDFRFVDGMTVYASPRRYEEDGYVKETIKWFHVATMLPRKRSWEKQYREIR